MSRHTPTPEEHDPRLDAVPGDPPVPVTVWRTPYEDSDGDAVIPARLARRLLGAYSNVGDAVLDVTDGWVLSPAAQLDGRRHHRGRLSTEGALVVFGEPTEDPGAADADADAEPARGQDACAVAAVEDIDPHMPRQVGHGHSDLTGDPPQPTFALAVAAVPTTTRGALDPARTRRLIRQCAPILRPGGCLALLGTPAPGRAPLDYTPATALAAEAGLGHLQHILAVHAAIDGDQFTYYATDAELAALTDPRQGLVVHTDVQVFTTKRGDRRA
ncbi:MAG: hypothetical protein ACRDT2_16570 [Natronosporangium sp.]